MSTWQRHWHLLYAAYDGTRYGEILDAHDRQLVFDLLGPNQLSFSPKLSASMTNELLTHKEGLILAYAGKRLAMTAEIASIEASGDESDHGLTVTAVETMHTRLIKRLLGKSAKGLSGPTSGTDQGTWLMNRLDDLNDVDATGLTRGVVRASGNISGGTWRYKPWMELAQELAATVNGFDFYQRPRDPKFSDLTGVIDIEPVIGTTRDNIVFQYGSQVAGEPVGPGLSPANAREWRWIINHAGMLNRTIALPPSFPDNAGLKIATANNLASQAARGLREEVIPTDLSAYELRLKMAQLHALLRANPREQFIIQPAPADGTKRVPQFLEDYNVGDKVRGRVEDQGLLFLDAMVRVYGVTVSLDDLGKEEIELKLINDGAATA